MARKIPKYGSEEYWKTAKEYRFKTVENGKPSGEVNIYAHSKRIANLKATNWEKWLIKNKKGTDKVIRGSIKQF